MKLIALEKEVPHISGAQFQPHLKAEALRAWELYQAGIFREIYFDKANHNAVIVMECESTDEAAAVLATLPLVREGLITFQIIALEPYSGFARLFIR